MYSGALRLLSINTNTGQMAALRILDATNASAQQVEQQIATGLRVAGAKDDGAAYAIAQNTRALSASYDALSQVQDRAQGLLDVTQSSLQSISDILIQMKKLALSATDTSLTTQSRAAIDEQFQALKSQIDNISKSSGYMGNNLIDSSTSNFLNYGGGVMPSGTSPVEWGNPPTTSGEPQPGDPLSLHFGFQGIGQKTESIDGSVAYSLRYWDGSSWNTIPLATSNIPTTEVGPNDPIYDASANAAMPTLPPGASNVQIYAEYTGTFPATGGRAISDVIANGDPSGSDVTAGKPHLLASWNQQNWSATPAVNGTYGTGFQVNLAAGAPVGQSTEAGQTVSGSMQLAQSDASLSIAGFDYSVAYQVQNPSSGAWDTLATSSPQSIAAGDIASPTALPYSLTIPPASGSDEGYTASRLVAHITVHHDTPPAGQTASSAQPNSSVNVTSASLTGQPGVSMANAVASGTSFQYQATVNTATPTQPVSVTTQATFRWFDGASWNQTPIGAPVTVASNHSPINIGGQFAIPNVGGTVDQAQITLDAQVTSNLPDAQNPAATPIVENNQLTVLNWNGTALSNNSVTQAFAQAPAATTLYSDVRTIETSTKVDTLSGVDGSTAILRDQDTTTAGLQGLTLVNASLSNVTSALSALDNVDFAQTSVTNNLDYYSGKSQEISTLQNFDLKYNDDLKAGIGSLVDANMAQDAASLQAIQVKQQMAVQALSIANTLPQLVLRLFK